MRHTIDRVKLRKAAVQAYDQKFIIDYPALTQYFTLDEAHTVLSAAL